MKHEDRYIVLKKKDIKNLLSKHEHQVLANIIRLASNTRDLNNKPPLKCVVVESDWPMYKQVWKMIEAWVDK